MTSEEYEEQRRRLEANAADAKKTHIRAKSVYDSICDELRNLRVDWQEQQKGEEERPPTRAASTGPDGLPLPHPGCEQWRMSNGRVDLCAMPTCARCQRIRHL